MLSISYTGIIYIYNVFKHIRGTMQPHENSPTSKRRLPIRSRPNKATEIRTAALPAPIESLSRQEQGITIPRETFARELGPLGLSTKAVDALYQFAKMVRPNWWIRSRDAAEVVRPYRVDCAKDAAKELEAAGLVRLNAATSTHSFVIVEPTWKGARCLGAPVDKFFSSASLSFPIHNELKDVPELSKLEKLLGVPTVDGLTKSYWESIQQSLSPENMHAFALELCNRCASLVEFRLALFYSNTSSLEGALHYFDYHIRKNDKSNPDAGSAKQLIDIEIAALSDTQAKAQIDTLQTNLVGGESNHSASAKKWWEAAKKEWGYHAALAVLQEVARKRCTITDLFMAYVYSNTDNFEAVFSYMRYCPIAKRAPISHRNYHFPCAPRLRSHIFQGK